MNTDHSHHAAVADPGTATRDRFDPERVLRPLAVGAHGLTGADIERVVRELRQKVRRGKAVMSFAALEAGLRGSKSDLPEGLRRRLAIHEAGHAVVRHSLKLGRSRHISIDSAEGGFAEAELDIGDLQTEDRLQDLIAVSLAGRAAEIVYLGTPGGGSGGSETSDLARATQLALAMETRLGFAGQRPLLHLPSADLVFFNPARPDLQDAVHVRLEKAHDLAAGIVDRQQDVMDRVIAALLRHRTLEGRDLERLLDPSQP